MLYIQYLQIFGRVLMACEQVPVASRPVRAASKDVRVASRQVPIGSECRSFFDILVIYSRFLPFLAEQQTDIIPVKGRDAP